MKKSLNLVALLFAFFTFFGVAEADHRARTTTMTGAQEVPPTGSPGSGSALLTIDTVTNLRTVNVAFAGLLSPTTIAHIHCCAAPGAIAIPATTVPSFPGFPLAVTTGTYLQTFDLTIASP